MLGRAATLCTSGIQLPLIIRPVHRCAESYGSSSSAGPMLLALPTARAPEQLRPAPRSRARWRPACLCAAGATGPGS
eukprot:scaffold172_cov355-Prasinococcus_capsulatus_cf.AAC.9